MIAKDKEKFPKTKLLRVQLNRRYKDNCPKGLRHMWWKAKWFRMANAGSFSWMWLTLTVRLPWLPEAAWSDGWDACWRQLNGLPPEGNFNTRLCSSCIHEYFKKEKENDG